ncbi:hypothetical protein [Sphingomonas sp. Root710]|uniref:hypothetical protein n=1 Tax=Sphingomonas sp. Root710 TaxID=1736594 RepID=UPI000AEFE54C|nr:hypothetical protein [Sphingomonas sp. Root710]
MNSHVHPTDEDKGNGVELSTEEARSGATPHVTRYVLVWGLALVIIAFAIVLLSGMLST